MAGPVLVVATGDTKARELLFVAERVREAGVPVIAVDVGTTDHEPVGDVGPAEVLAHHPDGPDAMSDDRGEAVTTMAQALKAWVAAQDEVGGIIGLGGSGNTALVTPAMRALPVGVPKLMVSTVASGDVSPYVGPSDIAMLYSVADVAGLNRITRTVLANAAAAIAGMAARDPLPEADDDVPAVGVTMFGVTTPAVEQIVDLLVPEREPLVFHATGTGGQSMENLVSSGLVEGVIDLTTTEVCDELMGGVFTAGPTRFDVYADHPVPYVGSVGALDMVNFGARDTVPDHYDDRLLHVHNANVTLMRTTAEENTRMGEWIAAKLNAMAGPVRFLLPEGGVSMLDAPGQAFHDPAADAALFDALEASFVSSDDHELVRLPHHVNDPAFARAAVDAYLDLIGA